MLILEFNDLIKNQNKVSKIDKTTNLDSFMEGVFVICSLRLLSKVFN